MGSCSRLSACLALISGLCFGAPLAAQQAVGVSGRLVDSVTSQPIAGATVQIDELREQTISGQDGSFRFESVPPGRYHFSVRSSGYSSRRTEVSVESAASAAIELQIDPELHFQEVTTVGPEARSQFDAYQPTSVLSGQELEKQLEMSLGETLRNQAGVASRSFGPAPARPVIRGLDGDRVLILQDGQRTGDLSSQSGDHGPMVNPVSARRIEVVRGPATLLYGANAIGGLVNVITDDIPTRPVMGTSGRVQVDLGSAAAEGAGAGAVQIGNGRVAMNVSGGARRSGDVDTPEGAVLNSQSRSGFADLGAAWTGERGYLGGSYGYVDSEYGIPVVEGGVLRLTPKRHAFTVRGGARNLTGLFDEFRSTLGVRRYEHTELEGDDVGTVFQNDTTEIDVLGSHRAFGRLKGSVGAWFLDRAFDARGEEALSPAVDQRSAAAFLFEELSWPHLTVQFGGRVEHTAFEPIGEPSRDFTNVSGSLGLLLRPAAANDRLTIAASLARAARNPALEELFFFGLHHGNFAVELGNPQLESERGLGFDLSLRWRGRRASGEISYFRNSVSDFIFRNPLDEEEFEAREEEFEARFPGRELVGHDHHEHEEGEEGHEGDEAELPFVDFVSADALLQGVEAHADFQLTSRLFAEGGFDYVRGTLTSADQPLPRIPPLRARLGFRYQQNALQAGGELIAAAKQERISGAETATDGYTLLKLFASYSFTSGKAVSTVTARLDNVTDELYRNHLSLIKDFVPEMGRNFKLLYSVKF